MRESTLAKALYKGLLAAGMNIPTQGTLLVTVADKDKEEALDIVKRFRHLGFKLMATAGTADYLEQAGLPVTRINKLSEGTPNLLDVIHTGEANIVLNTLTKGKTPQRDGRKKRDFCKSSQKQSI